MSDMDNIIQDYIKALRINYGEAYLASSEVRYFGGGSIFIRHPENKTGYIVGDLKLIKMTQALQGKDSTDSIHIC